MANPGFRFEKSAVHLPDLRLWLDAHEPIGPEESVFVSHAHSDHTAAHARVLFSAPTGRLMRARVGGERVEQVLEFGRRYRASELQTGGESFDLTLLPAGHIFGSAMSLLEREGGTLLYTGDFKLRPGLSAEACEPRPANDLIMETTYGRPEYVFPPTHEVMAGLVRFCREAIDNEEIPVLLGYSLGKSQEILSGLASAGLPIMLGEQVAKLTRIYESFGLQFPAYRVLDVASATGHVVLAPPGSTTGSLRRRLGRCRVAMLTGWAVMPGCEYRYQADAAFPLSDHADFPDLVEFVKRVAPRRVYTLHGFAADFAAHLRELGFEAFALSEPEQLEFALGQSPSQRHPITPPRAESFIPAIPESVVAEPIGFRSFALACAAIGSVASKLEKTRRLAEFLRRQPPELVPDVVTWFTGQAFAASENKKLSVGGSVIRQAVLNITGGSSATFRNTYLKHSDTGETVAELLASRSVPDPLQLPEVVTLFDRLLVARGPSQKEPLLAAALSRCGPLEAKFLVKILTGDLRIGLKEGLVEEAVAAAFDTTAEAIRSANQLLGNLGEVAQMAQAGRLADAGLVPFRPVRLMLASPEPDAQAVWDRVCAWSQGDSNSGQPASPNAPAWIEDKYDGIRCQLHKVGGRTELFSRDLKDITGTFPELAEAARRLSTDVILDGEILAIEGDRALPFSHLQRRLGRREGDLFLGGEIPVRFIIFDLLWKNGTDWLKSSLRERRAALEGISFPPAFQPAQVIQADSSAAVESAFGAARARGNEGLMIKDPASPYTPGRRGLSWLKLKKAFATLDCVVVGVEYGHGKRKAVLSDYTFAIRDEPSGELRTIGKAYSGLTDAEIARLTTHFLARVLRQRGRFLEVRPDIVLEIAFDSLRESPRHTSGLAMRFPRISRIREDKAPAEIDTLATARRLAGLGASG